MIVTETFYGIKCNRCGKICEDDDVPAYWANKDFVLDNAVDHYWLFVEDKHYCENCHNVDKNIPFLQFPEPIVLVKKYIENLLEGYDLIVHDTPRKTVLVTEVEEKMEEHEKLWIKATAGNMLIRIRELEPRKNIVHPFLLIIEFKNPK